MQRTHALTVRRVYTYTSHIYACWWYNGNICWRYNGHIYWRFNGYTCWPYDTAEWWNTLYTYNVAKGDRLYSTMHSWSGLMPLYTYFVHTHHVVLLTLFFSSNFWNLKFEAWILNTTNWLHVKYRINKLLNLDILNVYFFLHWTFEFDLWLLLWLLTLPGLSESRGTPGDSRSWVSWETPGACWSRSWGPIPCPSWSRWQVRQQGVTA